MHNKHVPDATGFCPQRSCPRSWDIDKQDIQPFTKLKGTLYQTKKGPFTNNLNKIPFSILRVRETGYESNCLTS